MNNNHGNQTLNVLLGLSIVMRIGLLAWQLHRMYRLEQAEKEMARAEKEELQTTNSVIH